VIRTPVTDLTAVGEGRGTVLSLKLDRLSDSVSGQTVVEPKGYLTDLKSMKITSDAEISDGWVRLAEKRKPWMKRKRTRGHFGDVRRFIKKKKKKKKKNSTTSNSNNTTELSNTPQVSTMEWLGFGNDLENSF
jgi:hypothetical protein